MSRGGHRLWAGRPPKRLQTVQLASEDVRVLSKVQHWNPSRGRTWVGDEEVRIDWQACRFGGHRAWFVCPGCQRRCALLFLSGQHPRCARCRRLAYPSQSMDPTQRSWLRTRKMEARLGVADSRETFPFKRKWKHWDRYEQLLRALQREDHLRRLWFCQRHAALLGLDPKAFENASALVCMVKGLRRL